MNSPGPRENKDEIEEKALRAVEMQTKVVCKY